MKILIVEALDLGADVLLVRGTVDGEPVEARGWLSALAQHYPDSAYELGELERQGTKALEGAHAGRRLKVGAQARAMTAAERRHYCETLLAAAAPKKPAAPRPVKL